MASAAEPHASHNTAGAARATTSCAAPLRERRAVDAEDDGDHRGAERLPADANRGEETAALLLFARGALPISSRLFGD